MPLIYSDSTVRRNQELLLLDTESESGNNEAIRMQSGLECWFHI